MKKIFYLLLLLITISISCDKDDFCTQATTPNLIVTFYNKDSVNVKKKVTNLSIKIKDIVEYKATTTDSIAIPLNTNKDTTNYTFTADKNTDILQISYTRKNIFVSRSCGYKTTFLGVDTTKTTKNWIKKLELKNTNITNEKTAHITIYH